MHKGQKRSLTEPRFEAATGCKQTFKNSADWQQPTLRSFDALASSKAEWATWVDAKS